jgi:hypothetical protein
VLDLAKMLVVSKEVDYGVPSWCCFSYTSHNGAKKEKYLPEEKLL